VNGESVRFGRLDLPWSVLLLFRAIRQVESLDENLQFRFCVVYWMWTVDAYEWFGWR